MTGRRYVALLRGVNLGASRALAMPDLVRVTEQLGHTDVRTHLRSGNVVLTSAPGLRAAGRAGRIERALAAALDDELGLRTDVIVRSRDEIAHVVEVDPLHDVATEPARHLVNFLAEPLPRSAVEAVDPGAHLPEQFAVDGREIHLWLPGGVNKATLPAVLTPRGVVATSRNWNTVTRLLELLDE